MANKPFAIQGADLTLGGVNLQAGTTGVVIPGVTRATSYKVEEVDDRGDQTLTFTSAPVVIDYQIFLDYLNNGSSTGRAEYSVDEIDGDGYIDGISVNAPGAYTANESSAASRNDMWAYIGTAVGDEFNPFVDTDWQIIPFRPKIRAGAVETIGSGSGSGLVQRTVNYPYGEDGDTAGTMALAPNGNVYVCTADYVAPNSEPVEFDIVVSEAYNISQDAGHDQMSATIAIGDYPAIDTIMQTFGYQATGWQIYSNNVTDGSTWDCEAAVSTGNRWSFIWTYHPGNDSNSFDQGEEFTLFYTATQSATAIWTQANLDNLVIDGQLITSRPSLIGGESVALLGDDALDLYVQSNQDHSLAEVWLHNNDTSAPHADINVRAAAPSWGPEGVQTWSFQADGSLVFPDSSVQTTAYTGQGGGVTITTDLWIAAGSSPGGSALLSSTDGVNWTPRDLGIIDSYIKRVAVSDTMIVYLMGINGGSDAIYYADAPETTPTLATGTNSYAMGLPVNWDEINYLGGKFVAVGSYTTTATVTATINGVTLPDGNPRTTTFIGIDNTNFDFSYVDVTISGATNTELNGNFRLVYNQLDPVAIGVYDLVNTDGSPVVLTSTDVTGATLVTTQAQTLNWPIYIYSTDGITWTYGTVDPGYFEAILGSYPSASMSDVAYNGTGYLIPVVDGRFSQQRDNPVAAGPGAFYITDLAVGAIGPNFIPGAGLGAGLPGTFNNIASYADGTFFVSDDQFTVWTASNPLDTWTPHDISPSLATLFGYTTDVTTSINGDVDSAVAGTVNGQEMWVGSTNEGAVIYTTDNGQTFQGSIPDPYTATATLVTSTSSDTLLDFAGSQEVPYQWEKITLTVALGDDTNWNGTYYAYSPDNSTQFYLYNAVEGNGIPSDGFTAPSSPFNITLSHGRDLDAIHVADNICIVHSSNSNTLYRSTDLVTWTKVYVGNGDYSVDDIYYGTRSTTASNRLDYTDEETGYNSSAVLTYNFKVDVDNAHLDVNGNGSWELGSDNNHVKIGTTDLVDDGLLDIRVKTPNAEWTFDRNGKLHFPDGTRQSTAYVHTNINMDGGGAAAHYEQEVGFVDGGFSSTRHGVADPTFNGGNRLTEDNQYNLNGGGA